MAFSPTVDVKVSFQERETLLFINACSFPALPTLNTSLSVIYGPPPVCREVIRCLLCSRQLTLLHAFGPIAPLAVWSKTSDAVFVLEYRAI